MGGLNPTLEAVARRIIVSRARQPVMPAPPRAGVSESDGDPVTADLDLTRILAMPLDQFAREGQLLEVRVPWLDVMLWFVPAEREAEALAREGVSRGQVWTARELSALMALPDRKLEIVQGLALAKRAVDGDIVEVRPTTRPRLPTVWTSGSSAR